MVKIRDKLLKTPFNIIGVTGFCPGPGSYFPWTCKKYDVYIKI